MARGHELAPANSVEVTHFKANVLGLGHPNRTPLAVQSAGNAARARGPAQCMRSANEKMLISRGAAALAKCSV